MSRWPELSVEKDHETFAFLHLASQMLGKVRLRHSAWTNHGWHIALQPVPRGLQILPTRAPDGRTFSLLLDLCRHAVVLTDSAGAEDHVPLESGCIAVLHAELIAMLSRHRLPSDFHAVPNEIADAVPFARDRTPRRYSRDSSDRLRDALARAVPVFESFRAGFAGKCSPVHFWWGSFDLAVTRFSGRRAPEHPGGIAGLPDSITREAYSHEVSSAGFWPGGSVAAPPIFYSYAYPEPRGFRDAVLPVGRFDPELGEFVLPYDDVRASEQPEAMLEEFLNSSYERAAALADWDRPSLERAPLAPED